MRRDLAFQIFLAKEAVKKVIDAAEAAGTIKPFPLGHAFLWGTVEVKLKNGKSKYHKVCLTSVCAEDLDAACRIAETVPGVTNVWFNLD